LEEGAWELKVKLSVLSVVVSGLGRTVFGTLVSEKYSDIAVQTVDTGTLDDM
jgi:hypothetical protein